jgi:hypothetical protein
MVATPGVGLERHGGHLGSGLRAGFYPTQPRRQTSDPCTNAPPDHPPRILHTLVENQVDLVWERFVTPLLPVKSYDKLNAWLLDQCVTYATAHPRASGQTPASTGVANALALWGSGRRPCSPVETTSVVPFA